MWNFQGMKPHSFLLSKTQSLSLLCRVVAGGIPTSIPSLSSTETWHLIIPPVFSCLEKKPREVPRKVAKQNGNWSTSPSGHGCFKHHSDSTGAELFDGELGGGVTPQAADPWHGTSDQFLVKRLSTEGMQWLVSILKSRNPKSKLMQTDLNKL